MIEKIQILKTDVRRAMIEFGGKKQRNRYNCDDVTATFIFIHKLSTTVRWTDLELKYGMFIAQMSEVFWEMAIKFVQKYEYLLELWEDFLKSRAEIYANTINAESSHLDSCTGFIECTKIRMCRPGGANVNHRACFIGHKRMTRLIYQSLSTPDGLIFAIFGTEVCRRHYLTLYQDRNWDVILQNLNVDGRKFYIFGASAYLIRPWLQRPFLKTELNSPEAHFNKDMSSVRMSVEHNYRDLINYWICDDFARNLRVGKPLISILYKESAILTNFHVCLYKIGQIIERFRVDPPSLEEYLSHCTQS